METYTFDEMDCVTIGDAIRESKTPRTTAYTRAKYKTAFETWGIIAREINGKRSMFVRVDFLPKWKEEVDKSPEVTKERFDRLNRLEKEAKGK